MSEISLNDFILNLKNQNVYKPRITITNIKMSFKCNERVKLNEDVCISYYKAYNFIVKYLNITYTFLGKNHSHVNITGLRSIYDIKPAVIGLTKISNLKLNNFKYFTIDNISVTYKTHPGLKQIISRIKNDDFNIFKPTKFCGIVIKHNNCSLTYFNSGNTILVGIKKIPDLNIYVKKFDLFFMQCCGFLEF